MAPYTGCQSKNNPFIPSCFILLLTALYPCRYIINNSQLLLPYAVIFYVAPYQLLSGIPSTRHLLDHHYSSALLHPQRIQINLSNMITLSYNLIGCTWLSYSCLNALLLPYCYLNNGFHKFPNDSCWHIIFLVQHCHIVKLFRGHQSLITPVSSYLHQNYLYVLSLLTNINPHHSSDLILY